MSLSPPRLSGKHLAQEGGWLGSPWFGSSFKTIYKGGKLSAKYSISIEKRAFLKEEGTWVLNISERHPEDHDSSLFLMYLCHIFQMFSNPGIHQQTPHVSIFINMHLCRVTTLAFYKFRYFAWPSFWELILGAISDHLLKLNLAANVSHFFSMEKKKCQRPLVCK